MKLAMVLRQMQRDEKAQLERVVLLQKTPGAMPTTTPFAATTPASIAATTPASIATTEQLVGGQLSPSDEVVQAAQHLPPPQPNALQPGYPSPLLRDKPANPRSHLPLLRLDSFPKRGKVSSPTGSSKRHCYSSAANRRISRILHNVKNMQQDIATSGHQMNQPSAESGEAFSRAHRERKGHDRCVAVGFAHMWEKIDQSEALHKRAFESTWRGLNDLGYHFETSTDIVTELLDQASSQTNGRLDEVEEMVMQQFAITNQQFAAILTALNQQNTTIAQNIVVQAEDQLQSALQAAIVQQGATAAQRNSPSNVIRRMDIRDTRSTDNHNTLLSRTDGQNTLLGSVSDTGFVSSHRICPAPLDHASQSVILENMKKGHEFLLWRLDAQLETLQDDAVNRYAEVVARLNHLIQRLDGINTNLDAQSSADRVSISAITQPGELIPLREEYETPLQNAEHAHWSSPIKTEQAGHVYTSSSPQDRSVINPLTRENLVIQTNNFAVEPAISNLTTLQADTHYGK